jgi:hypothetical protein
MTDFAHSRMRFIAMLGSSAALTACGGSGARSILPNMRSTSGKAYSLIRSGDSLTLSGKQGEILRAVASSDAPMRIFMRGVDAAPMLRKPQSVANGFKPGDWISYADGSRAVVRASGHIVVQDAQGRYTIAQDNRDGTVSIQNKAVSDTNVRVKGRIWTAPRGTTASNVLRKTRDDCEDSFESMMRRSSDYSDCSGDGSIDPGTYEDPGEIIDDYQDPSDDPGWIDDSDFSDYVAYTQPCQDAIDNYRIAEAAFVGATAAVILSPLVGPGALVLFGAWLIADANLGRTKGLVDRACKGQGYNWV